MGKLAIAYQNLTFRDFQLKKHPIPAGRSANVGARYAALVSTSGKTPLKPRFQPLAGNAVPGGRAASKGGGSPNKGHSQSETGNETISKSLF
ncbi:MAG: hypothetical protein V7L21_23500 [Nostoc sp.]|uniref:hypothetical protein n=1 Tax=Nostoc sp. TaxID=1180 RepID=UPI002FF90A62